MDTPADRVGEFGLFQWQEKERSAFHFPELLRLYTPTLPRNVADITDKDAVVYFHGANVEEQWNWESHTVDKIPCKICCSTHREAPQLTHDDKTSLHPSKSPPT